jgi:cytoskeletal protein RodZ
MLILASKPCVSDFTSGSQIAGCNAVDITCICSNKNFLSGIACCLVGVCSAADQQAATEYAQTLCRTNGVTNLPSAVSCASTATQSSTAAPSGSTATSGTSTTSTSTSATDSATTHSTTTSGTAVSASTSAPAATKNAGPHNMAGVGAGILGGLVAAAALM